MDQKSDTARLLEAVIGLEQAVSGMAVVLEQQGRMLHQLVEASMTPQEEETRLHQLILALITRLDTQAGVLGRVEDGLGKVGTTVGRTVQS